MHSQTPNIKVLRERKNTKSEMFVAERNNNDDGIIFPLVNLFQLAVKLWFQRDGNYGKTRLRGVQK